jgi:hypothetical protein
VLLSRAIDDADPTLLTVATSVGVLAALVQFLGLVRWPFLVPYLARAAADPGRERSQPRVRRHRLSGGPPLLGVAVGEHLGYALTGAWTTVIGIALTQTTTAPSWVGVPGIVIGPILMLCALEVVGSHEPTGWKPAERLTPITHITWSLWLIATGLALLA